MNKALAPLRYLRSPAHPVDFWIVVLSIVVLTSIVSGVIT